MGIIHDWQNANEAMYTRARTLEPALQAAGQFYGESMDWEIKLGDSCVNTDAAGKEYFQLVFYTWRHGGDDVTIDLPLDLFESGTEEDIRIHFAALEVQRHATQELEDAKQEENAIRLRRGMYERLKTEFES